MIRTLIKIHNYTYYHGFKSLIWSGIAILFAIGFFGYAFPAIGANIIHDILTGK